MATVPQSPWFGSVKSFKPICVFSSRNPNTKTNSPFKTLKVSSSSAESSSSESLETDPVKLAFEKAKAYKKLKQQPSSSIGVNTQNPGTELLNSRTDFFKFAPTDPVDRIEPCKESIKSETQNPVPDIPNLSNDSLQMKQTDSLRLELEEINKGFEKSTKSNTENPVQDLPSLLNDSLQLKETDIRNVALGEIKGFSNSKESNTAEDIVDLSNNSLQSKQTDTFLLALEEIEGFSNSTDSTTGNRGQDILHLSKDSLQLKQEDSLRLALEEIEGVQNSKESNTQNTVSDIVNLSNNSLQMKQTDSLRLALEEIKGLQNPMESNTQFTVPDIVNLSNDSLQLKQTDSFRQALEEIKGFEKSEESTDTSVMKSGEIGKESGAPKNSDVPMAVKLALEKAREYKQKKVGADPIAENKEKQSTPIIQKPIKRKDDPKISSMDFAGLNFADKKQGRGLPAGLLPTLNPYTVENLPEVEIILGDQSKFGKKANLNEKKNTEQEKKSDIYEPTVSTWGVFPRPRNISEAYGGGKVINPGDVLETEEESAAKEARAKQLVAAYRNRVTLKIEPALKAECEKDLKDGDSLMDQGNLKQALPLYQKIMDKLPFETELHGLAALQWSICQDSLLKSSEARVMYDKLQSHPKANINKKAKDFMFTFQAMEMMKVKSLDPFKPSTEYKSYFEAFVEDKSVLLPVVEKTEEVEVDPLNQALPYILFLFSPIFLVLFAALQKGSNS